MWGPKQGEVETMLETLPFASVYAHQEYLLQSKKISPVCKHLNFSRARTFHHSATVQVFVSCPLISEYIWIHT